MTSTIADAEGGPQVSETPSERAAFLAERLTGIGGTDAAAIVGADPYKTPYELWLEKRGETAPEDLSENAAVEWGNRLEDVVADAYAERTGQQVHRVRRTLRHPEHLFMMAHLDRRIVGARAGLEVKTAGDWAARSDEWGPDGSDRVPMKYLFQVQHYMAVTGYERFDVAVLIGGRDFRVYPLARNEDLIAMLIEREAAFWASITDVHAEAPPAKTIEDAQRRWPVSIATPIQASTEIVLADSELRVVEADLKRLEAEALALKTKIVTYMGEHDTLMRGSIKLRTYKSQETTRVSTKAVKEQYPDVAAACSETSISRVFRACKVGGAA